MHEIACLFKEIKEGLEKVLPDSRTIQGKNY